MIISCFMIYGLEIEPKNPYSFCIFRITHPGFKNICEKELVFVEDDLGFLPFLFPVGIGTCRIYIRLNPLIKVAN